MGSQNITLGYNMDIYLKEELGITKICQMAAKIAYYNFEWRFVTLVIFNAMHMLAMETFFSTYKKIVVVKKGNFVPTQHRVHVPQLVIFGQESAELSDTIQWLIASSYDNNAKLIIICSSSDLLDCDEHIIFKTLAENRIANVVFLKTTNIDEPEQEAYSYHPILPNKCWNSDAEKLTDLTHDCLNDTCYKSLFPDKFNNLHQCPLVISTFEQHPFMFLGNGTAEPSGGDGDILGLVTRLINATLIIKTPVEGRDWGHYENHNWTGSLGDVFNNRADGSMCSSPLSPSKYGNFQISFTYNSMDMVWAAALPALEPSWEKLLYPLPIYMRITLLFMFIGIIFMNTFTKTKVWRNIRGVLSIAPLKTNLLMYSWILFLGVAVLKLPSKASFRIMFYSWMWFCLIIRSVYQGGLVSSLKLQVYQSSLESFGDVLKNRYPFGGQLTLREYYSENPVVYDNWKPMTLAETYDTLDRMSDGSSNIVIAINKETITDRLLKYNGTRKLQIIPEKIVNSPTVIYFKKNSHFAFPISKYLTIALEGGFSERLYARYLSHGKQLFRQEKSQQPQPLRFEHFTGCTAILLLGWLLSVIFFIVEIVCG